MNTILRTSMACLAVTCVAVASTSDSGKRLTPRRVAELTAPADAPPAKSYTVSIEGLIPPPALPHQASRGPDSKVGASAKVTLLAEKPEGVIEVIRELRFPVAFEPPAAANGGAGGLTKPITPSAFETVNTGWTIRLKAKPEGKLVGLYGIAEYVEPEMILGGYGPLSGPIHSDEGKLISPNVLHQPKFQTTSTRFHIFAVPGEPYEVALHHGAKSQKYRIFVRAE